MVGFETKRDMAMARYADMETIDHIIDLRKRLAQVERERDNALSFIMKEREITREQVKKESDNVVSYAVDMAIVRAENDWLKDKIIKLNGVITKLSNELKIMRDNEE